MISIIGLLAAILFPVFSRVRENARRSACASNMKQLGLGLMQYTQDYDETFPLMNGAATYGTKPPYSRPRGWLQEIYPYTRNIQIYQCPSETHGGDEDGQEYVGRTASSNTSFGDYQYNGLYDELKVARVQSPSLSIVGTEGIAGNAGQTQAGCGINFTNCTSGIAKIATEEGTGGAQDEARHLGGLNLIFADGHCKWFKLVPGQITVSSNSGFLTENIYMSGTPTTVSQGNPTFSYK